MTNPTMEQQVPVSDNGQQPEAPQHFASKEEILGLADVEYRDVYVAKWGFCIRLKSLTGRERDRFEASIQREGPRGQVVKNYDNVRARLLALTIVDTATSERMFTKPEEILQLGTKNAEALSQLFVEACRMNGITQADVKKLEEDFGAADGDSEPT